MIKYFRSSHNAQYWVKAWAAFGLFESAVWLLQFLLMWYHCPECPFPPPFYLVKCLLHLLFTGLLWYALNTCYTQNGWLFAALNILIFFAYQFLWVSMVTLLYKNAPSWIVGSTAHLYSWTGVIYESWPEIGRYVLKASVFYVLKHYLVYQQAQHQRIQLAVINKDLQMNLLQEQLSPHFYFNTLNNLYGLARRNSSKLQVALQQLSTIMQYVLDDCNHPKVSLRSEVAFLESYIALEKLRYEEGTIIDMAVNGKIEDQNIMPMVLIQLVENAFKHGMHEKTQDNWMLVRLHIEDQHMSFSVENSCTAKPLAEGIGLQSIQRRLQLQYPGQHHLEIQSREQLFSVSLNLYLH